jgi:hypothetical protein
MAVTFSDFVRPLGFRPARLYPSLAVLFLLACGGRASAHDYYVMVFASQRDGPSLNYSHTWATFVKATRTLEGGHILEAHTISWLPANGMIRVAALLPEPGRNFDLVSTLNWARDSGQRIFMWGPYQINPDLFARALAQKRLLESGTVRYKAIDTGRRSDRVSNCIHAVASVAEGNRLRVTSMQWGETASALVARELQPGLINPGQTYDWVATPFGVNRYPVVRRNLDTSQKSFFRRPLFGS